MRYHSQPFGSACTPLHRRGLAMGVLGLLLCLVLGQAAPAPADELNVVLFNSNKVKSFTLDADGNMLAPTEAATGKQPRTITLARHKRVAYLATLGDYGIDAFDIDRHGHLTKRPKSGRVVATRIFDPARSLALNAAETRLYVPEYLDGSCLPTCSLSNSWLGVLEVDNQGFLDEAQRADSHQIPRAAVASLNGRQVYSVTQGNSEVCIYNADPTTAHVDFLGCRASGVAGTYPESVRLNGNHAYMVNSGDGTNGSKITVFEVKDSGLLHGPMQEVSAGKYSLDIAFHPSGRYAAVPDHYGNKLLLYRILIDGSLVPAGIAPTGAQPDAVAFDRCGDHIFTADFGANGVSRFAFNAATEQLTPLGMVSTGDKSEPTALALFPTADARRPTSDFNADRHSDILWQNDSGEAAIWEMNGTSVIDAASLGNPGRTWHAVYAGDFNGDCRSDILWQNDNGQIAMWEMTGFEVLASGPVYDPGQSWHVKGTGDFNGDGFSDILWQNDDGSVAIWEMNGSTIIASASVYNLGAGWQIKGTGDFNGDGFSDIVWQKASGEAVIWEMDGFNIIASASLGNPGVSWHVKGTGDFNGDGFSDILWQNDSGEAAIWEMNGATFIGGGSLGNPGRRWHVKGTGDFNGDGFSAILWQNDSGEAAIWEMNGTTFIGGASLGNPGQSWHEIGN